MTLKSIKSKIALQPLAKLNAVLVAKGMLATNDKEQALNDVTILINDGHATFDDLANAVAQAPTSAVIPDDLRDQIKTASSRALDAVQQVENAQSSLFRLRDEIDKNVNTFKQDFGKLDADLRRKLDSIQRPVVDQSAIDATIRASVSQLFNEFRGETKREVLAEIAQTLGTFDLKPARDVFGADTCRYDSVDFGDMQVGVWNDPDAPALVDDYVFNPSHLHQTLIALDDPLPDNVWLAGERGTGKTEFVSQVASRLGRRLYRINFDEALERADFIGGNSIENSNVVWKPGIITQAIQHPGAIVLLDEIGFARAQSLAVLHALCERSPHRAVTISETGERIKVASHVVFFGADNSNGHGDHSGNFAGVREQNTAFLDRFSFTLRFEYLTAVHESELIAKRTGLSLTASEIIVKFANVAREKARAGLLTQPPSLRQLFAWARSVKRGLPVDIAFRNAIINKFPSDCEAELHGVYVSQINTVEFIKSL